MEAVLKQKKPNLVKRKFLSIMTAGLLGYIVYIVSTFVDSIIAGNFLNESALAAVSVVSPIGSLLNFFGSLLAYGCGVMYAYETGKGNVKRTKQLFGLGLVCSAVLGVLVFLVLFL